MSAPLATSRPRLPWFAVLLPPLLWIIQGTAGWYLGGHECPSSGPALPAHLVRVAVGAVTLVGIVIVAGLLAVALRRRASAGPGADAERVRFVAALATVAGLTLLVGLMLAGLPALMVQTCGQAR